MTQFFMEYGQFQSCPYNMGKAARPNCSHCVHDKIFIIFLKQPTATDGCETCRTNGVKTVFEMRVLRRTYSPVRIDGD